LSLLPKNAYAKNLLNYMEEKQKELYDTTVPSVCYISTEYTSMGEKFNIEKDNLPKGVGTGFVWDNNGHIITNFHVINKVDNAIVTITKKNLEKVSYKAKLTGIDPDNDLAVLKIDAPKTDLTLINYNPNVKINVGEFAFAIGNPFGQDHTLTTGIISGINRELSAPTGRKIYNVIQTDAAINPGNSGGPLLNSNGELLGINTASLGMGVSAGIGFTIPINTAVKSIKDIIETGYVQKPILGITYMERNPTESESLKSGLPIIEKGLLILDVPNDSPAIEAGLRGIKKNNETQKIEQVGDIIVGIDNNEINTPSDLYAILRKYKPGDRIKLKYLRENKEYITEMFLGNYKGTTFTKLENERGVDFDKKSRKIDIPLKNLEPKIEPKLN
jgi:S1-C subfamily serine protease